MESLSAVTFNMMGLGEPLARRMELIYRGLRALRPDIVGLQEVCTLEGGGAANQAEMLAERLGLGYRWAWERAKGLGGELGEGLAILSRHRIRAQAAQPLPTAEGSRIVMMVELELPNGAIRCFNTHLDYHPSHGPQRERQVLRLDEIIRSYSDDVPAIVMGDFNATPDHDEIRFLRGRHTIEGRRAHYHDTYARARTLEDPSGMTWARRNSFTRRWWWLEADRRIDYIFLTSISPEGLGEVRSCRVVLDQPDDEGLYPSDHFGVLAEIWLLAPPPRS